MRFWVVSLVWLLTGAVSAQVAPGSFVEPGTRVPPPPPPPPVGACIGGDCTAMLRIQGPLLQPRRRAARAAYASALFGVVSAGLVLGGALAIGIADDPDSERVTRGVWLSYVAVAAPVVGLTGFLARRERGAEGSRSARRLGWSLYASAITLGTLQWVGAFKDYDTPRGYTIGVGVMGALTMLPLAFDAYMSARGAQVSTRRLRAGPGGVALRF